MESLISAVSTFGMAVATGAAVVWMGRRRGIDQVEARSDHALQQLVEAQSARLALMDTERSEMRARITALETEVARLRSELEMERRITARFTQGDGR